MSFLFVLSLKLLYILRQSFAIQIREAAPILLDAVMLKVFAVISVIYLFGVIEILPLIKVCWHMSYLIFLFEATDCTLFFFQASFFVCSNFEVSVFKGPLVRTESAICRRERRSQRIRHIIELNVEVTHSVHVLPILWVGAFLPGQLDCPRFNISQCDCVTPSSLDFVSYLAWRRIDTTNDAMIAGLGPATFEVLELCILLIGLIAIFQVGVPLNL